MWLKILGLMMQPQGVRTPQSSLTVDTKAAVNSAKRHLASLSSLRSVVTPL